MQQWMFLFDGYGMSTELDQGAASLFKDAMSSRAKQASLKTNKGEKLSNEICQPYLVRHLSSSYKLYTLENEAKDEQEPDSPAAMGARPAAANRGGRRASVLGGKRPSMDLSGVVGGNLLQRFEAAGGKPSNSGPEADAQPTHISSEVAKLQVDLIKSNTSQAVLNNKDYEALIFHEFVLEK
jgi:hypothetical protein